ncbi:MAG: asparagine synthase (glutamine-hydrolyzing) [Bacteroidia bacterium]
MCGITGMLAFTEEGKKYLHRISDAVYCLKERGPDGEGIYFHENASLGHRRLSIIDTSAAASQPFSDASGRYTIVFNGEIFNFRELRQQLENKGAAFRSQSDTEVLLQLYISEKEKCLEKLDGEFSFVVYDDQNQELFLCRDRFGIKPLYFYSDSNRFVFASEMKAMIAFGIPKEIDPASLRLYFHLNYIPSPWSVFQNTFKLEPGCFLKVSKDGKIQKSRYYTIEQKEKKDRTYEQSKKELRMLLEESVKRRMISDVPLGTFLSGGIDSSIITAIAASGTKHLKTFSIGYKDEPLFDETKYAELVAKKYKTDHTAFQLSNEDLFENLHTVLDYIDEPFADSSALAVNILSMHTKKQVTVALSGDGADELFAGYNKHAAELKARSGKLSARLVGTSHGLLKKLPKSRNTKTGNKIRQLEKFAEGMGMSNAERYWSWAKWAGLERNFFSGIDDHSEQEYARRKEDLLKNIGSDYNSVLLTDMKLVLENDMLVKVDRMSMSHGLEVRVPFLDHKIADFAFSLPANEKITGTERKKILRDAFRGIVPEELMTRKKKGFEVPLLKWFRTDLRSMITEELLSEEFIRQQGLFNPDEVKKIKSQLFSHDPNDAVEKVWALIVFQYWWKKNYNC